VKTYHGIRTDKGCLVTVETDATDYLLPHRFDLWNHSPDGFEWGYGGSGPAQLALAILADAINAPRARKGRSNWQDDDLDARTVAVRLHQEFKRKFIAGLPRDDPWAITEQQVEEFVKSQRREDNG